MPRKKGICTILEGAVHSTPGFSVKTRETSRSLRKSLELVLLASEIYEKNINSLIKLGCEDSIKRLKEGI